MQDGCVKIIAGGFIVSHLITYFSLDFFLFVRFEILPSLNIIPFALGILHTNTILLGWKVEILESASTRAIPFSGWYGYAATVANNSTTSPKAFWLPRSTTTSPCLCNFTCKNGSWPCTPHASKDSVLNIACIFCCLT